ncbi:hypothetical protein AN1V17_50280 [Vallitalea sediminicola]
MNDILNIVGNTVRQFRTAKNLSQEELALRAKVHPTHIGRVERGAINCTIEMLNKIITALGISFEDFFKQIQPSTNTDNEVFPVLLAKLIQLKKEEQESILEFITNYKLIKKE